MSLIRAHLVHPNQPILRYTDVVVVYRKVCHWLVMRIPLTYNNSSYWVVVLKADDLLFPILLGRDAPAFDVLMHSALPRLAAIMDDDEKPGPSRKPVDEPPLQTQPWDTGNKFLRAQETGPMLTSVRDNIAIDDGQVLDAHRPEQPGYRGLRR